MKNFQKKKNKHSFLIKRGAFRSRRADSPSSAVIRVTTPRKPSPFAICLCCLFFYETVSDSTLLFEEGSQKKKELAAIAARCPTRETVVFHFNLQPEGGAGTKTTPKNRTRRDNEEKPKRKKM